MIIVSLFVILIAATLSAIFFRPLPVRVVVDTKDVKETFFRLLGRSKRQAINELDFLFYAEEPARNRACIFSAARMVLYSTRPARVLNTEQTITPFYGCTSLLIRDVVLEYILPGKRTSSIQHYYLTSTKREREVYKAYEHERICRVTNATSCVHATVLKYLFPNMKINLRCQDKDIQAFYQTFLA